MLLLDHRTETATQGDTSATPVRWSDSTPLSIPATLQPPLLR